MNHVAAIAVVTFREALRQRLAVNLLVFALGLLVASVTISSLTFGEQDRIIIDLSLTAMETIGTLIAVFLGAGLVARDVERRTLFPVLAKRVTRAQYVLGRYLGLVITLVLNLLVMAIVFGIVLAVHKRNLAFLGGPFLPVILSMAIRFAMIGAVAVFFSCLSTATLASVFALSLVVAGHLASDLLRYWAVRDGVASAVGRAAFVLVPNLEALNLKEAMVYGDPVAASFAWTGVAYGLAYAAAVSSLAVAAFARRDLR